MALPEPDGVFFAKSSAKQPMNRFNKYGRKMPLFQTRTFVELGKLFIAWGEQSRAQAHCSFALG